MAQIQSLAVSPASVETTNWRSSRYKHWVNGFIVDGDYWLVKVNKRTFMRTAEYVWNEVAPPFEVPEGEGVPTLVNPDDPFYIWDKKPEQWHPCWFRWVGPDLTIVDMVTGETIGRGRPCQADVLAFSCPHDDEGDTWAGMKEIAADFYKAAQFDVVELSLPSKARVLSEMSSCRFWHSEAHGTPYFLEISFNPRVILGVAEAGWALRNTDPYIFAFISSCDVMNETGLGTFSHVFTKNLRDRTVVGLKHVTDYLELWRYVHPWKQAFYDYLRLGGLIGGVYIEGAFENAVADYPMIAPIVGIFPGSSYTPEEFQNLIMEVSPPGSGYTEPTSGCFEPGKHVRVEAHPYPSYEFDHWEVDGYVSETPILDLFMGPTSLYQLTAHFKEGPPTTALLTISLTPSEGGYSSPVPGTYTHTVGTRVDIYIYPNPGYILEKVKVVRDGQEQDTTDYPSGMMWSITSLDADTVVTAYFRKAEVPPTTCALAIGVSPLSSGTTSPPIGTHTYNQGDQIQVNAYPNPGYEFDHWEFDSQVTYEQSGWFTIGRDTEAVAYFKVVEEPPPGEDQHTFIFAVSPSGSGYTDPPAGTHIYDYDSTVIATAYPNPGYEFDYWDAGGRVYMNPITIKVWNDNVYTAHFKVAGEEPEPPPEEEQHTLTFAVAPSGSGYTNPAAGSHVYDYDITVIATAYPNAGFAFDYWEAGVGGPVCMNPITIKVWSDNMFTAHFKEEEAPPGITSILGPLMLVMMMGVMAATIRD